MHKNFYQEILSLYDRHWYFISRRKVSLSILNEHLQNKGRLDILDVGVSTGGMLGPLSTLGKVIGIDNSDVAIQLCRKKGYSNVVKCSAEDLPFAGGSFDLICAMDILEHVDDDEAALKEFFRVLRPGGLLFMIVPAHMFLWGPHDEINMHKRRYSLAGVSASVEQMGFRIEKISYFNFFSFPIAVLVRAGRSIFWGKEPQAKV